MPTTYLVVPATTDQAGQLRIVARRARCCLSLVDYRHNPDGWGEAGLVSSTGRLVCLDAPPSVRREFTQAEPIRPPLVVCQPDEVAP